jgi:glycosyltransferase involved in cell wall biosynthesis
MRILKVHNYYTGSGGEDTVFHTEAALLRSRGHEVIEYLEHNKKIESMNQISVALQTIWSYSSYQKLKHFLRETKPEIVHFHNTFPLISPSAYYACQELSIPVVQTLDNQRLMCPAASFYRDGKLCLDCLGKTFPWPGVLHACYHNSHLHTSVVAFMLTFHRWIGTWQTKVDIFLCSTSFYRNLFLQAGFPAHKLVLMPHSIQEKPQRFSRQQKGEYALFIGRLDPEKGVKTLLDAWRSLKIPLKIRGDGQLDQAMRDFVFQNNMMNVEFIDRLEKDQLIELRSKARFLVWPSEGYYETFGLAAVECFAQGIPVIASRIGVITEIVEDGKTGLLFNAGDPVDLAAKVQWLWDHPEEGERMGDNARREYEAKYTAERNYEMLMKIYSQILETRNNQ